MNVSPIQTFALVVEVVPPVGVPLQSAKVLKMILSNPISVAPKSEVASNLSILVAEVVLKVMILVFHAADI